jgi:hypothetical protein
MPGSFQELCTIVSLIGSIPASEIYALAFWNSYPTFARPTFPVPHITGASATLLRARSQILVSLLIQRFSAIYVLLAYLWAIGARGRLWTLPIHRGLQTGRKSLKLLPIMIFE